MMSDASDMLAAALEQMDGIIAGNHTVHFDFKTIACFLSRHSYYKGVWPHLESIELQAGNTTTSGR